MPTANIYVITSYGQLAGNFVLTSYGQRGEATAKWLLLQCIVVSNDRLTYRELVHT
jgi:hypothetical protein